MMENSPSDNATYSKRIWIKGGIYALIVIVILLLKATFSVLLLILAGALIAIFFRGLSELICRKTKWKEGVCLAVALVGTLLLMIGLLTLIGAKVQSQVTEMIDKMPSMVENAKTTLQENAVGRKIIEKASTPGSAKKAEQLVSSFFKTTFGVFGDIYVVLFLGIFFTVSPGIYKKGVIAVVPNKSKSQAENLLKRLTDTLQKWLKGKIFAMGVVFVLTAIGLLIMGVPMWLALALIAGILNFIPNFGPLIAMIPAFLVGLMKGFTTGLLVVGLYILIQVLESNLITPQIQKRLIEIPPALIIISQLLMGVLTGGWGLILATPLVAIVMVSLQELWINKQESDS